MVYTVEKVCLFFNTGLSGGRFACYSIIASIEFLQKGSTFLGLRTLFLDGYSWVHQFWSFLGKKKGKLLKSVLKKLIITKELRKGPGCNLFPYVFLTLNKVKQFKTCKTLIEVA